MTIPETQALRHLRKTANLLNSVAETAWAADTRSSARWDLHRIGTDAYLAQRDILDMLCQPGAVAVPQADFDIAAALDDAAQTMATIPEEFQTMVTQRLHRQISSLAERAIALRPAIQLR